MERKYYSQREFKYIETQENEKSFHFNIFLFTLQTLYMSSSIIQVQIPENVSLYIGNVTHFVTKHLVTIIFFSNSFSLYSDS